MIAAASRSHLNFADRLVHLLDYVDYRRADTPDQREAIYRLRYDAYLKEGMTKADARGMLVDRYDDAANAWTFGLYVDDQLSSSIRINVASERLGPSPATAFFPDLLGPDLAAGRVIVDPNRLVTEHTAARAMPELAYLTVRLGYVAAWHFDADVVTATVRAEHQAFYKRVFGLRSECLPRTIPPIEKPFCLMSFREASMVSIMNRYPCFRSTEQERSALFDRPDGARVDLTPLDLTTPGLAENTLPQAAKVAAR
ncbi:hypothetical protein LGH83_17915 [Lichenihabitans sp. PAMC28606]|uniref:N-acyl amino acid synthase FeeM domain-containing protein n=1 Tax=Lichenihabitans sp. PAMC28606 TaxID=2880932 RepID=UPI001D0AA2D8|nr:hypothetical protein [Lichenihabitans sp. PAMC28606]UDL94366.1 hypothetical protein LGH83_17915 [Lichenihabitans sp. PAMC28606]